MPNRRARSPWSFSANFYSIVLVSLTTCGIAIALHVLTGQPARESTAALCVLLLLTSIVQCYRMRVVCTYSEPSSSWILHVRHTVGPSTKVVLRDAISVRFTPNWSSNCFASISLADGGVVSIPCLHGLGPFRNTRINRRVAREVRWIERLIAESAEETSTA